MLQDGVVRERPNGLPAGGVPYRIRQRPPTRLKAVFTRMAAARRSGIRSAAPAGAVAGGDTGDVSVDYYHRYEQDIALMKSLRSCAAIDSHCVVTYLSGWRRTPNPKGVDFYNRVVDELPTESSRSARCITGSPQALQMGEPRYGACIRRLLRLCCEQTLRPRASLHDDERDSVVRRAWIPLPYINVRISGLHIRE